MTFAFAGKRFHGNSTLHNVSILWMVLLNQNLYGENDWDFYFRNHSVALYTGIINTTALGPGAAAITETPVDAVDHSYGPLRITPVSCSLWITPYRITEQKDAALPRRRIRNKTCQLRRRNRCIAKVRSALSLVLIGDVVQRSAEASIYRGRAQVV